MRPYSTAGFDRLELTIDGRRTVAYMAGSGPAVVYLHGGGTFHGFEFAREWLPRYRVLVPYHPGFGESDDAPEMTTLQAYVRHYCTLLDRLGLATDSSYRSIARRPACGADRNLAPTAGAEPGTRCAGRHNTG